jgi:hypothetical protein
MRIGKYNIRADNHQFILEESTTVKDEKSKNFGSETLVNPSFHTSWGGLIDKLIKLEAMTAVNEANGMQGATDIFKGAMIRLENEAIKQLGRK